MRREKEMKIAPTAEDERFAKEVYERFRAKPGSARIASAFALAYLAALLRERKPRSVLELGAGIGTVTWALLAHPAGVERVVATEDVPFCLDQLEHNLDQEMKNRLHIITKSEEFASVQGPFELLIIDGVWDWEAVAARLREGSACFVEGQRKRERADLREVLRRRNLDCVLTPYRRGFRIQFTWEWPTPGGVLRVRPRMRLNKRPIKGCWVGEVKAF